MNGTLDEFVGQPSAVSLTRELLDRPLESALPPVLLDGPPGSGRSVLGGVLLDAWSSAQEPGVNLSGYQLVMDDAAPTNEQDRRYSVHKVRQQLSRRATGARTMLLNLTGAGVEVQNALLKLLEEPPQDTRLILLGDGALLDTVRSRCHLVPLRPLDASTLQAVAGREGWTADERAVELSCGSARRLHWLSQRSNVVDALAQLDGAALAELLYQVGEDKDAGVTQAAARRQWCEMVLEPLAMRAASPAAAQAVLSLRAGFKPEACLALALLALRG